MSARPRQRLDQWLAIALFALVAADFVTKALAERLLQPGVKLGNEAFIELTLSVNSTAFGVWAASVFGREAGERLCAAAIGQLALAGYLIRMKRLGRSWIWTFFAGAAVFGLFSWVGIYRPVPHLGLWALLGTALYYVGLRLVVPDIVRRILAGYGLNMACVLFVNSVLEHGSVHVSQWTGAMALRSAQTVVFVVVLWLVRQSVWQVPALLFTAAALGNGLSWALPPHTVTDFIYSAPLTKYLGHGVMNLADLYFDAAVLSLSVLVVRAVWLHLRALLARAGANAPPR